MPWKVKSSMSLRQDFVAFARQPEANISALCRRLGISRKTAYKWLGRARDCPVEKMSECLMDRSRRPLNSPGRTDSGMEQSVLELRIKHPAWGARKLKRRLEDLGHLQVPARSTVNGILQRHGLIDPTESLKHNAFERFERKAPNELWQMDFKGHLQTAAGLCHPLTILDDHSRFNLLLRACANQQLETVRKGLIDVMRLYGMPSCILCDNGAPWASLGVERNWTTLGIWLVRLGVSITHGRPYHPQTQGKEERFHRTLKAEAIGTMTLADLDHSQKIFDQWRPVYNHERPHEALNLATPATRYTPSPRAFLETLPPIEYGSTDQVRRVCEHGDISFGGKSYKIGKAFTGEPVAVRHTTTDGIMNVYYCHQRIAQIDLTNKNNQNGV
jgi:transposase InsO family protein